MKMEDFDKWLKELVYPKEVEDFIEVLYDGGGGEVGPEEVPSVEREKRVAFYTDNHKYFIKAIEREGEKGYLGCGVSARKPRAGETWTRGNDLPDGPFTKETLDRIEKGIIAYELEQLSVRSVQPPISEDPVGICGDADCNVCGG